MLSCPFHHIKHFRNTGLQLKHQFTTKTRSDELSLWLNLKNLQGWMIHSHSSQPVPLLHSTRHHCNLTAFSPKLLLSQSLPSNTLVHWQIFKLKLSEVSVVPVLMFIRVLLGKMPALWQDGRDFVPNAKLHFYTPAVCPYFHFCTFPFCVLLHWEVLCLAKQASCYCRMVHSWAVIKFSLKIFKLSCVPFIFIVVIQRILLTYLLNKWKLAVLKSRTLILLLTFPAFLQMCNSDMFQSLRSRLPPVTKLVTALPYLKAADKVKSQLWPWHLCYKIFTNTA